MHPAQAVLSYTCTHPDCLYTSFTYTVTGVFFSSKPGISAPFLGPAGCSVRRVCSNDGLISDLCSMPLTFVTLPPFDWRTTPVKEQALYQRDLAAASGNIITCVDEGCMRCAAGDEPLQLGTSFQRTQQRSGRHWCTHSSDWRCGSNSWFPRLC
jgi:hypothetical protein